MSKITGTVKWFSNKKGFGFIAPTSANSPTTEEIFVHQTSIHSDGEYRTRVEGSEVEFEIEKEDSGKLKAVNVTSPGGGPIKPPVRERKRPPRKDNKDGNKSAESGDEEKDEAETGDEGGNGERKERRSGRRKGRGRPPRGPKRSGESNEGRETREPREPREPRDAPKKEREPPFHAVITEDEKKKISAKGIELGQKMTIDLAFGDARVKLGQGGYAGLAHASGMIGEGTYKCDQTGFVTFSWERCLEFVDGKWTPGSISKLMPTLSLTNDNVTDVKLDETAESLWGEDKTDPKEAFIENGFKMKRVVLTRPPGVRGRRRGRPSGRNGKSE